jgi:hypothetical protein
METTGIDLRTLAYILLALIGAGMIISLLLVIWVIRRIHRIRLPQNADFLTALRATPFIVVLVLDLLDFSLDFLSAPISWFLLRRLGLGPLQGATLIEGLIPGTQMIPTMTLAWVIARIFTREQIDRIENTMTPGQS